jgi:hypothetical protein
MATQPYQNWCKIWKLQISLFSSTSWRKRKYIYKVWYENPKTKHCRWIIDKSWWVLLQASEFSSQVWALHSLTQNLHREALNAAMSAFQDPSHLEAVSYDMQVRNTRKVETARWHALEDYERHLQFVQALECKLEIKRCWTSEDAQWCQVGRLITNRKYQRALDRLEGLIVVRIFKLTKMNWVGTGEFSTVISCKRSFSYCLRI